VGNPSRWLNWRPPGQAIFKNGAPATKPSKPSKPQSTTRAMTESMAVHGQDHGSEPTGLRTVECQFAGLRVRLTVARHNLSGVNRFGQEADRCPYCLVNIAAWRAAPFDLRLARWFDSREAAASCGEGRVDAPAESAPAPTLWSARFPGGVQVELRLEQGGRWLMWVVREGVVERRKDFASPYAEHAKRTAEQWFGALLTSWSGSQLNSATRC
jgi:hypothetical protein